MSLIKSASTVGGYTFLSRILGYVRDMTIAANLGASYLSDAFFVAFKLPNFLRRLFAEGAFNVAFVPMFSGMLATEGKDKAREFAAEAMSFLLMVLFIVTAIFILCMPWLMYVLAPGFSADASKFELTIALTRITMPYIIFISMVSLLGGILNSDDKFAVVAATPILLNLTLILLPMAIGDITPTGAHALAIGVFVAGILQWAWLYYFCLRRGLLPTFRRPRLTADVKKLLILIAPAALGAGVAQINLFIDLIIASLFSGGVSYLYYADRINGLPLSMIGVAVGTVLLPVLSRQIRTGDKEAAYKSQNNAISFALFLTVPSMVAIAVLAEPIIQVMFERGEFQMSDVAPTYKALIAFTLGLPAFVLVKILAPCFFANQDTKTPFIIASFCILINLLGNLVLMQYLQHVGLALATSIASWVNAGLMIVILRQREWLQFAASLGKDMAKIFLAALVMGALLVGVLPDFAPYLAGSQIARFSALFLICCLGGGAYMIMSLVFNTSRCRVYAAKLLR